MYFKHKGLMYVYVQVHFIQVDVNKVDVDTIENNVVC